jgi:hypothetical protein
LLLGANMSTGALFHDEMSETTGVGVTHCNIGTSARPTVVFSGFYKSHEPPPSGDARGIVLPHRHGHRNGQQRGGGMLLIVVLIVFLAAAGAIRSE